MCALRSGNCADKLRGIIHPAAEGPGPAQPSAHPHPHVRRGVYGGVGGAAGLVCTVRLTSPSSSSSSSTIITSISLTVLARTETSKNEVDMQRNGHAESVTTTNPSALQTRSPDLILGSLKIFRISFNIIFKVGSRGITYGPYGSPAIVTCSR